MVKFYVGQFFPLDYDSELVKKTRVSKLNEMSKVSS